MRIEMKDTDVYRIRNSIRIWVNALASQDFELAASQLTTIPDSRVNYDGNKIRECVGMYSRQFRESSANDRWSFVPTVNPPEEMDTTMESMVIYVTGDQSPLLVEYDLPLDGEWSDLTVKFLVVETQTGFGLGLHDIRVM